MATDSCDICIICHCDLAYSRAHGCCTDGCIWNRNDNLGAAGFVGMTDADRIDPDFADVRREKFIEGEQP